MLILLKILSINHKSTTIIVQSNSCGKRGLLVSVSPCFQTEESSGHFTDQVWPLSLLVSGWIALIQKLSTLWGPSVHNARHQQPYLSQSSSLNAVWHYQQAQADITDVELHCRLVEGHQKSNKHVATIYMELLCKWSLTLTKIIIIDHSYQALFSNQS